MPQRIAQVAQEYAGRQIEVGEAFDVEPAHIQILSLMGRIEREADDPIPGYMRRDVVASPANRAMSAKREKRAYNRKAA